MDIWQLGFLFSKYVGNRMQEITQHKFCVFLDTIRQCWKGHKVKTKQDKRQKISVKYILSHRSCRILPRLGALFMLLTFLFNSVNGDATHALAEEKEMTCNLVVLASAVTLYICIKQQFWISDFIVWHCSHSAWWLKSHSVPNVWWLMGSASFNSSLKKEINKIQILVGLNKYCLCVNRT